MIPFEKERKIGEEQLAVNEEQLKDSEREENAANQHSYNSTTVLMPELEALVEKNPNRLIGCGG